MVQKTSDCFSTWAVSHSVKVAVGEHEMLAATFGLQLDDNISDVVVEARETTEKVDGERAGGSLHVYSDLMRPRRRPRSDVLYLLQQVTHRQDLVLLAPHRPGADAGDLLQVPPRLGGAEGLKEESPAATEPENQVQMHSSTKKRNHFYITTGMCGHRTDFEALEVKLK